VSVFKLFAVGSVAVIAFMLFTIYAQPHAILEDRGFWLPVPEDMPQASRNLLCSFTDCRYVNMTLQYYIPRYVVNIVVYEPAFAYVILIAGVLSMVTMAYFASRIEDMSTKKAIAVVAGLYGAGMTALMFMRKDFRAAAPILAPVAAALMVSAFVLYLMLRASGHKVTLTVRKDSLQEQKITDAMKAVRKRKAAKRILKK
jgi:predicted MFS family arabinose efflux permease